MSDEPIGYGLTAAPGPQMGRGRLCTLWVTPWVNRFDYVILDTRTAPPDLIARHAGPDTMPYDCLLVLIHPAYEADLVLGSRNPLESRASVAARLIDQACQKDARLAARIGWGQGRPASPLEALVNGETGTAGA